jgi:hypothetical protein
MDGRHFTARARPVLWGLAALLALPMTVAAPGQARESHREDSETCASFGIQYGSRDYSRCMLAQQRRRDVAPLHAAEQQRLSAEAARNNLETVRRMRCEREAKRDHEQGVRPRRC